MLKVIEKTKPRKRTPIDWQPLIQECLTLLESGKAKSKSEAAWIVARNHAAEGISYHTLRDYFGMWQRFHAEPKPLQIPLSRRLRNDPLACSVEGCDRPQFAREFCSLHYQRFRAHGDPLITKRAVAEKMPWNKNGT